MKIDYSDVDEHQKIRCQACLPSSENKAELWNSYVSKDSTQEKFSNSSGYFYNTDNHAQCVEYGDKFLNVLEEVKSKYHRDYAKIFFNNLSPSFLGLEEHLPKFQAMLDRAVAKNTDSLLIKLLSNEVEKLEEIIKIKGL